MSGIEDDPIVVGIVSDTHGPLDEATLRALAGSAHIIHAGDIVDPDALEQLSKVAPTTAVRGNMDNAPPLDRLPTTAVVGVGDARIYVLHNRFDLDLDPAAAGFAAVVFGHTHKPLAEWREGVLYLNPGSPRQPRGGSQPSAARLIVTGDRIDVELVALGPTRFRKSEADRPRPARP